MHLSYLQGQICKILLLAQELPLLGIYLEVDMKIDRYTLILTLYLILISLYFYCLFICHMLQRHQEILSGPFYIKGTLFMPQPWQFLLFLWYIWFYLKISQKDKLNSLCLKLIKITYMYSVYMETSGKSSIYYLTPRSHWWQSTSLLNVTLRKKKKNMA